ncbi:hypothetical protein [Sinorhizobium fredii]|uniref:hypothetical protein n=1 Tax=Rhizobium fredii TaxID=380 RepID=UPI0033960AC4
MGPPSHVNATVHHGDKDPIGLEVAQKIICERTGLKVLADEDDATSKPVGIDDDHSVARRGIFENLASSWIREAVCLRELRCYPGRPQLLLTPQLGTYPVYDARLIPRLFVLLRTGGSRACDQQPQPRLVMQQAARQGVSVIFANRQFCRDRDVNRSGLS